MANTGITKTRMLLLRRPNLRGSFRIATNSEYKLDKIYAVNSKLMLHSSWRGTNPVQRYTSARAKSDLQANQHRESINGCEKQNIPSYWIPHQRTGIYFPEGHDWVMDDVPDSAASFGQTYWIRTVDGVDKPDQDHDADYYSLTSSKNNA